MPFVEDSDKLVYWGLCQHPKEIKVKEMGEGGGGVMENLMKGDMKIRGMMGSSHYISWQTVCELVCGSVCSCGGGGEVPLTDKC